jgi:hypothetical protein
MRNYTSAHIDRSPLRSSSLTLHKGTSPIEIPRVKTVQLNRFVPRMIGCLLMIGLLLNSLSVFAQPFQKPEPIPPAPIPGPSPKPLPPAPIPAPEPKPIPPAPPR